MKKILYILIGASLIFSCDNDIDVNANWKDVPVVYSLVDQTEDTVWVRLSKAFLGEGDVFMMAQQPDSLYYNDIQNIFLEEFDENGNPTLRTFQLIPDFTSRTKPEGIFDSDNYRLYRTDFSGVGADTLDLNEDYQYQLVVNRGENRPYITAKTELVKDFDINKPRNNQNISFSGPTNEQAIEWESAVNGSLYETRLYFHYTEVRVTDFSSPVDLSDSTQKVFEFRMPDKTAATLTGSQDMSTSRTGQAFLTAFLKELTIDPNIVRIPRKFDVEILVASEEFTTFINVNKPPTGIVRERPDFTNVKIGDDDGVGIFTSRYRKLKPNVGISSTMKDYLSIQDYTCGYNIVKVSVSQSINNFKAEYDSPDCSVVNVFEFNQ